MWIYNGKEFDDVGEYYGFVYIIENKINARKYIGKKFFIASKTRMVKKKKKKYKAESDWKKYYGSSEELKNDVETLGKENFTRTILHLCKSKSECAYLELHEQVTRKVLFDSQYYNKWIFAKIRKDHLIKSQINF